MNTAMLSSLPRPFNFNPLPTPISLISSKHHVRSPILLRPIKSGGGGGGGGGSSNGETSNNDGNTTTPIPPPITPPDAVEIRFRRGSRRRRKQQDGTPAEQQPMKGKTAAPKNWESMTLGEKATELYTGEKGLLFWLNKFAYASIFIIIGGWIVFRFVGPALNLYQLDSPPLSPTSMFKG